MASDREILRDLKRQVLYQLQTRDASGVLDAAPPFVREEWCQKALDFLILLSDREGQAARFWQKHPENTVIMAVNLWALLSDEVARPIYESLWKLISGGEHEPASVVTRQRLIAFLEFADIGVSPLHRPHMHSLAMLPRPYQTELVASLRALSDGEVRPLLAPERTGGHGNAYTWNRARLRAVEHVQFLHGQGPTKKNARERVAHAVGISVGALRSWEESEIPSKIHDAERQFELARAAGNLFARYRDDPTGRSQSVDGYVYLSLKSFESEPLAEFARRYKENFGRRHWSRGSNDEVARNVIDLRKQPKRPRK
jgi:hypothetical protein